MCPIVTGEAVNNNAGLGISGRDNNGKRKWDLVNNADVAKVEVSLSEENNVPLKKIGYYDSLYT